MIYNICRAGRLSDNKTHSDINYGIQIHMSYANLYGRQQHINQGTKSVAS